MRTGNPALIVKTFENFGFYRREPAQRITSADTMPLGGSRRISSSGTAPSR